MVVGVVVVGMVAVAVVMAVKEMVGLVIAPANTVGVGYVRTCWH